MRRADERSGGNPLFLQELVAGRADGGRSSRACRTRSRGWLRPRSTGSPAPTGRSSATPSVLGRELRRHARRSARRTARTRSFDRRCGDGWRSSSRTRAIGRYRFRHALMRDAAYEGLPFRRRRELHARVGSADPRHVGRRRGPSWPSCCRCTSSTPSGSRMRGGSRVWRGSGRGALRQCRCAGLLPASARGCRPAAGARSARSCGSQRGVRRRSDAAGEYRAAEAAFRKPAADCDGPCSAGAAADEGGTRPRRRGTIPAGAADPDTRHQPPRRRAGSLRPDSGHSWPRTTPGSAGHSCCTRDAIRWCRRALAEGEAAGELDATAHALYVLDVAEHALGVSTGEAASERALALYERLGNLAKQGDVTNNLGYYAYFRRDWNEASIGIGRRESCSCGSGIGSMRRSKT